MSKDDEYMYEINKLEGERDYWRRMHAKADAECATLRTWVADCQSGMYINCVYCGHRYGPREDTPVAKAETAALRLQAEELLGALNEICDELYGHGFRVLGWHLNGDEAPLDSWFEDNGWCEVAQMQLVTGEPPLHAAEDELDRRECDG